MCLPCTSIHLGASFAAPHPSRTAIEFTSAEGHDLEPVLTDPSQLSGTGHTPNPQATAANEVHALTFRVVSVPDACTSAALPTAPAPQRPAGTDRSNLLVFHPG